MPEESNNQKKEENQNSIVNKMMESNDTKKKNLQAILTKWQKNNPNNLNPVISSYCREIEKLIQEIGDNVSSSVVKIGDEDASWQADNENFLAKVDKFLNNDIVAENNFKEIKLLQTAIEFWQQEKIQSSKETAEGIDQHIARLNDCIKKIGENLLEPQQPSDVQLLEIALNRNLADIKSLKSLYAFWLNQTETDEIKTHLKNIYILIKELENNIPAILISSKDDPEGTWKASYDIVRQSMTALKNEDLKLKLLIPENNKSYLKISEEEQEKQKAQGGVSEHAFPLAKSGDRRNELRADKFAASNKNYINELFRTKSGKRTVFYNGKVVNDIEELRAAVSVDKKQDFEEALYYSHVIMQDPAGPYIKYSMVDGEKNAAQQASNIYILETPEGFIFESITEDYQYTDRKQQSRVIPGKVTAVFEYEKSDPGFKWKSLFTSNSLLNRLVNGQKDSEQVTEEEIQKAKAQEAYQMAMVQLNILIKSLPENFIGRLIVIWLHDKITKIEKQHTDIADYALLTQVANRVNKLTVESLTSQSKIGTPLQQNDQIEEDPEDTSKRLKQELDKNRLLLKEVSEKYDTAFTMGLIVFLVLAGVGLSFTGIGALAGIAFLEFAIDVALTLAGIGVGTGLFSGYIYKDIKDSKKEAEIALGNATHKPLLIPPRKDTPLFLSKSEKYKDLKVPSDLNKNQNEFSEAQSDIRRLLTAAPLQELFTHTFKNDRNVNITEKLMMGTDNTPHVLSLYKKGNKLLLSPVFASPDKAGGSILLENALHKAIHAYQPAGEIKEIIIPIVEEKSGLAGMVSESQHIKTLHIKNIQYNEQGKITHWDADYYDSKSSMNNYVFPSDNVQNIVKNTMRKVATDSVTHQWNNINPISDQPYQPLLNRSDCGYWVYNWCCALLDKGSVDLDEDFFNEDQMKLLHIWRKIKDEIDMNAANSSEFIFSATELFNLLNTTDTIPEKSEKIQKLYEIMNSSRVEAASESSTSDVVSNPAERDSQEFDFANDELSDNGKYQEHKQQIEAIINEIKPKNDSRPKN